MKKLHLLCAAAVIVAPATAFAQETTSSVRGQVTSGGAPVGNAQVTIVHEPSGTTSTTDSDSSGAFSASGLRVGGPYSIEVSADGYDTIKVTDLHLTAGEAFRVPIDLPRQEASKDIVVTGTRVRREESTGPITALTRTEIEGAASVNRDIRDLARRDAFVTMDLTNSRTIEVAGNNGRLNRFSVDGVQFSDDFGLNNGGLPTSRGPVPFDAIEQFSIKVAPYDIAEGDFQGGAINVILRSGGNKFKGSAFYTYSDDSLTGDKTDGQEVNLEFKSKQYGGFLSGPIIKDRLFFMVAYEKTKETDPFDDGVGPGFANQVPGVTVAQADQISQIAQSVYNYDTLGIIQNATEQDEKIVAKLDWNITDDHRAAFTYVRNIGTQQFQRNTFTTAPASLGLRSSGYELKEEVNSGVFQLNSDWTDSFSTELRVSHRDYKRDQTPFGGREFAQMEVCLDPTSVNAGSNTATSCGGSRIFFGPDISRHTNDLDTKNTSIDLTGRVNLGNHVIKGLLGFTQNKTFNLFLQRSLGDYYFDSIADFQNRVANRLRFGAAVPSLDPNDAAAQFRTRNFTFGLQDDWDVNDELQVTGGVRIDYFEGDDSPASNPFFETRYGFTNTHTFDEKYLIQPRVGFNWKPTDRLIVRGGTGVFGGGTPDVFVSNSFSNTGTLTNAVDISRSGNTNCANTVPNTCAALSNVDGYNIHPSVLANVGNVTTRPSAPVNAIDPDLDIASQWRSSLSANYDASLPGLGDGWLFGADLLYSKVIDAYQWTDLRSVPIGTLPDGRTRYGQLTPPAGHPAFVGINQDLLMTNSGKGRSIVAVARFSKRFDFGLEIDGSYTRSNIKDCNAITSATANSLYESNAFHDPNSAACGRSIYEIKDQWKFGLDFRRKFLGDNETRISLFGEYRSGRPYSITMLDRGTGRLPVFGTVGNGGRVLLYVPGLNDDRVTFISSTVGGVTQTADEARALFYQIMADEGLGKYRGQVVPKNSQTSPDFFKVDLHLSQEIPTYVLGSKVKLFADVENILNMIDSDWGALRQVSFPYTAPIATVTCTSVVNNNCTQYQYSRVTPVTKTLNGRQSLYQIRVGARFSF